MQRRQLVPRLTRDPLSLECHSARCRERRRQSLPRAQCGYRQYPSLNRALQRCVLLHSIVTGLAWKVVVAGTQDNIEGMVGLFEQLEDQRRQLLPEPTRCARRLEAPEDGGHTRKSADAGLFGVLEPYPEVLVRNMPGRHDPPRACAGRCMLYPTLSNQGCRPGCCAISLDSEWAMGAQATATSKGREARGRCAYGAVHDME